MSISLTSYLDRAPSVDATPVDWSAALCAGGSAEVVATFFSEQLNDIAAAKAICAECTVATACLRGALERHEPWGVWGGQLLMNGRVLAVKRKRGRPPRSPRVGVDCA